MIVRAFRLPPRNSRLVAVLLLCLVLLAGVDAPGQTAPESDPEIVLRSALVAPAAPGHFDLVSSRDPVTYALVTGAWRDPQAGEQLRLRDSVIGTWERAGTDSAGWFRHPALRRGYAVVTIDATADTAVVLHARGHSFLFVNGTPRSSNQYEMQDEYPSWAPQFNYPLIPVALKKGRNTLLFLCARGMLKVGLAVVRRSVPEQSTMTRKADGTVSVTSTPGASVRDAEIFFNTRDLTVPDIVEGYTGRDTGAVIIVNRRDVPLRGAVLQCSERGSDRWIETPVPEIPAMALRKVPFDFRIHTPAGREPIQVQLRLASASMRSAEAAQVLQRYDTVTITLKTVPPTAPRRETFTSGIDGSVQYYAVNPVSPGDGTPPALLFSLHGASVEAIGHASAYSSKTWANIVAPTNRRPYGFSWEDWGRLDALEVFDIAMRTFTPDPARVYLSGHSMGGHGTWQLGFHYPDRWAAIGPSAGWISFRSYRHNNPPLSRTPMGLMLQRAALPSDTYFMAENARRFGSYVLHGTDDDDVSVEEARAMVRVLDSLNMDYVFREVPGKGHWWDESPEPGSDCLDWAPMMDFFARHARPEKKRVRSVVFTTASPAVSSRCDWAEILQQERAWMPTRINIRVDPKLGRFIGSTENVSQLALETLSLERTDSVWVELDGQPAVPFALAPGTQRVVLTRSGAGWVPGASNAALKSPQRGGPFKDAFRNSMVFVYGTRGSEDENRWAFEKARADAEQFWYQGNGSVDVLADSDFSPEAHAGRNVILYGNATTNGAWKPLLGNCPVQVTRGEVRIGGRSVKKSDLCVLFLYPRPGDPACSVGAVSGTGLQGLRTTMRLAYLSAGVAFPDLFIAGPAMLLDGESGVVCAGFFGNDWSIERGEFVWSQDR